MVRKLCLRILLLLLPVRSNHGSTRPLSGKNDEFEGGEAVVIVNACVP